MKKTEGFCKSSLCVSGKNKNKAMIYLVRKIEKKTHRNHNISRYEGTRCIISFWYKVSFLISVWIPYDFYLLSTRFSSFPRWFKKLCFNSITFLQHTTTTLICTVLYKYKKTIFWVTHFLQQKVHLSVFIYFFLNKQEKLGIRKNFKMHDLLFT